MCPLEARLSSSVSSGCRRARWAWVRGAARSLGVNPGYRCPRSVRSCVVGCPLPARASSSSSSVRRRGVEGAPRTPPWVRCDQRAVGHAAGCPRERFPGFPRSGCAADFFLPEKRAGSVEERGRSGAGAVAGSCSPKGRVEFFLIERAPRSRGNCERSEEIASVANTYALNSD